MGDDQRGPTDHHAVIAAHTTARGQVESDYVRTQQSAIDIVQRPLENRLRIVAEHGAQSTVA